MTSLNRQPAGIPTGGQFATATAARPGIALDSDPELIVHPLDLRVGDVFQYSHREHLVEVEIIGDKQPHVDRFGRELFRYLARRSDTGAEGYLIFGPTAQSQRLDRRADTTATSATAPKPEWFDGDAVQLAETADGFLLAVRADDGPHGLRYTYDITHSLAERPLHPLVAWYADTEDEAKEQAALAAHDGQPADYDGPRVNSGLMRKPGFLHAVHTARVSIPGMQRIAVEDAWCGYDIVAIEDHTGAVNYRVHKADAWTEPTEQPVLPWSPPRGTRIAHVDMNGRLSPIPS